MPAIRRSLQPPDKAFYTKMPNLIPYFIRLEIYKIRRIISPLLELIISKSYFIIPGNKEAYRGLIKAIKDRKEIS
ncbi:hypothetical protein FOXB_04186 [Fusarium oxysporum f. sp. conglutinans Fo5176]|uniref:Uncharacterized protein n=1 Tax=Fusarium oxysporum (strain Fo5176) TaxID=660025 RepID=F9FCQ8_FUSOF|nr:hypothetical protein FOXB_04186 [Fusarium oxysporum f. sp. conglutinans Fo5176]